ncbi:phosphotransferase [Bacillus sp. JJ1609]|uniref:phosphotransferase family protein n=1 Tax=Bacillus sp. JJ1609 TaxID=3122977 RepID=UPI002FFE2D2E
MNDWLINKVQEIIGEVNSVEKLAEQGCTSEVRCIFTKGHRYILKSSFKKKYREWLSAEARVLETLKYQSVIPFPAFYGFIEHEDSSHLIMSHEDGITLTAALREAAAASEQEDLIRSFGKFLQHLHDQEPLTQFVHDEEWLDTQLVRAKAYVENGQTGGSLELLERLTTNKPQRVKQTMIHGDCTTDNVLVIGGEVRMFIDVAGMTIGDPRYDEALAIGRFMNRSDLLNAFYKGYTRYKVTREEYQYFDEGLYTFF